MPPQFKLGSGSLLGVPTSPGPPTTAPGDRKCRNGSQDSPGGWKPASRKAGSRAHGFNSGRRPQLELSTTKTHRWWEMQPCCG
jgi:hypothetical protein